MTRVSTVIREWRVWDPQVRTLPRPLAVLNNVGTLNFFF